MIFEVYKHYKLAVIVDEDAATQREIIVDSSSVKKWSLPNVDAQTPEPFALWILESRNLRILPVQFSKHFTHSTLNLHLGLPGHKWRERHRPEISPNREPHILQLVDLSLHQVNIGLQSFHGNILEFITVPEIETWMQFLDDRTKYLIESLVCIFVTG